MQVSLKWINELVNIEVINLNDLMNQLILGGFEVEDLIQIKTEKKTQIALEISATANRSDSLSIQGISREIKTLFQTDVKISNYSVQDCHWQKTTDKLWTTIPNDCDCSALIAVILENVTNFQVPKWIQEKLKSSNIQLTHTFLDFENYVFLETGYVFLGYDFLKISSKLKSSNFILSLSKGNETEQFMDITGHPYFLNSSRRVIRANNCILSLAGISPHQDYAYSNQTNTFFIEASIFNANKIRQQSRDLGLRTDRSARYEKSLKNTYLIQALYRLISLVRISNPNLTCKLHTIAKVANPKPTEIILNYQTVKEILGWIDNSPTVNYISPKKITEYLTRLNFPYQYDSLNSIWNVKIPELRKDDITREIDLVEEIARLSGFQKFFTNLPKIKRIGKEDRSYNIRKKITCCLLNFGWNEMIHYSLEKGVSFQKNKIALINPLVSDCSHLKSSLLPSLLQTTQENLNQKNKMIQGFEYGHVFFGDTFENLQEKECIAGIFGGIPTKLKWADCEESLTWLEAKGKMEQFFEQLNIAVEWEIVSHNKQNLFHPYKSAEIYLFPRKKLGIFGQINPILANKLGIHSEIYLFEFDLESIQNQIETNPLVIYQEYSLYPKIIKDLSFLIKKDIPFHKVKKFLEMNGTKFLSEINLLDEYMGPSIPDNAKSLCVQLIFQSKQTTLEHKKIERIVNHLQSFLINTFDVTLRN